MKARAKDHALRSAVESRCHVLLSVTDAETLRRAELTLHRWAEGECGDGYSCISRDETTGKPYREVSGMSGKNRMIPIPDRETGALKRVADVCARYGLAFYHQTDPRGCALYVAKADAGMTDSNYSSVGVAVTA